MSNIAKIEQQHRELVNLLNGLTVAVKNHEPKDNIDLIINGVIAYTEKHFADEERLMVQSGYPEIENHKTMHKELTKDACRLKDKLHYLGEYGFTEWFNRWPLSRALAHIQYADKQLEDYLIQHGVNE